MKKTILCTVCPGGCEIEAIYENKEDVSLSGNRCKRGLEYAKDELFDPKRTFTASVPIDGAERRRMPVRSDRPVPKAELIKYAERLKNIRLSAPVGLYETVLGGEDGGANIVTTMKIEAKRGERA